MSQGARCERAVANQRRGEELAEHQRAAAASLFTPSAAE
jgi:hypothetical protein